MGSNWKDYLTEGYRVLRYNGEMIICENRDRYESIKQVCEDLEMHIKKEIYKEDKRWFYLHMMKD